MAIVRTWEDRRYFATHTLQGFFEYLRNIVPDNNESKDNNLIIEDWTTLMEGIFEILDLGHLMAVLPTCTAQLTPYLVKRMSEVCKERIVKLQEESFDELAGGIRGVKKANAVDNGDKPLTKDTIDEWIGTIDKKFKNGLITEIQKNKLNYILKHEAVR